MTNTETPAMARAVLLCTIIAGVLFGFSLLILWLVTITNKVKFHVTDADLTQFNVTDDGELHYNLGLNITVRNPNLQAGIYFDAIDITLMYKHIKLETKLLMPFYQGRKGRRLLMIKFEGRQPVKLEQDDKLAKEFNREKLKGTFEIDVELRLHIRVKFGHLKIFKVKPKVGCGLTVPLISRGRSIFAFGITGCHVHY